MKARKHLLSHVFASLAALPLVVPPAYAAALPQAGNSMQVVDAAVVDRNGHQDELRVAQATEPPPADENDPEWKKKHEGGGEKPPAAAQKSEPPKQEPPKAKPPTAEPPKPEAPEPRPEEPKPEPPKAEAPKVEPPKPEPPKASAPAAEEPKPEGKRPPEPEAHPKAPAEKPAPEAQKPAEPKATEPKPAEKPAAEAPKPAAEPKATEKPASEPPKPEPARPEAPKPASDNGGAAKPGEPKPQALKAPGDAKSPADAAPSEKAAPDAATAAPSGRAPAALQAPVLDSAKQAPALDSAKEAPAPDSAKSAPAAAAPANQPAAVAPPPPSGQRSLAPTSTARQAPPPPKSDADAQGPAAKVAPPPPIAPADQPQGRRLDRRPQFDAPRDARVEGRVDGRDVLNILGQMIVRGGDADRFSRGGAQTYYDELPGGRTRETIERPNGVSVVTIRNRYGDVIQRSRIGRDGRETVLFYAPELERRPDREQVFRDPSLDLPPMQLDIPVDDYIIDTSNARNPDYYDFLREPPVEHVERVYSLDEVRYSARVRDKMRRVDLDTIHFATGSADVSMNEATSLKQVAEAMKRIIDRNPGETFLIEGHTDAVGSDQANLVLSDRRAESVAIALTDLFGIPPENLVTQGYGERYLKVRTDGPSQENRRVTIRRITPLVRPVASSR